MSETNLLLRLALGCALATLAGAASPAAAQGQQAKNTATSTASATSELELLHARAFVLEEPYVHTWRAEAPLVRSGWMLVLRAPLERIRPRQTLEPVLYVGPETAERVNAPPFDTPGAGEFGQLVVVVPAPLDAAGAVALDPWSAPTFLGAEALPEEVDAAHVARELARARRLGLGPARWTPPAPTGPAGGTPARPRPLSMLRLRDRNALDLELAKLVAFWSPEEVDLVNGLRSPVSR